MVYQCEFQGLTHFCFLSWNPVTATLEQAQGSPLRYEKPRAAELNYPNWGYSRPAYSQLTPNTGQPSQDQQSSLPNNAQLTAYTQWVQTKSEEPPSCHTGSYAIINATAEPLKLGVFCYTAIAYWLLSSKPVYFNGLNIQLVILTVGLYIIQFLVWTFVPPDRVPGYK